MDRVIATRRSYEKLRPLEGLGAEITSNDVEAACRADVVLLCVKPGTSPAS